MPIRARKLVEEKPEVATWIVSFSDMVTLLLAFFVLLQAFAKMQDPELFFVGQGSFRRAISGLGIPALLYGKDDKPKRVYIKVQHPAEADPNHPSQRRIVDLDDDKLRQMFDELARQMAHSAVDVAQVRIDSGPPAVRFRPGSDALTDEDKVRLDDWGIALKARTAQPIKIYVVGMASDRTAAGDTWELSARRAEAVADYLRGELGTRALRWEVRALGAGRGSDWCREKFGLTADGSSVGIAVLDGDKINGR